MLLAPTLTQRLSPGSRSIAPPIPRAPALSNQTAKHLGDSRFLSGQYTGGSTCSVSLASGGNFAYHMYQAMGGKVLPRSDGSYGVGSVTSLNVLIRSRFDSVAPNTNPAQATTLRAANADLPMSTGASGEYSFQTNPASVALCLGSANDAGLAYYGDFTKSMDALEAIADEALATGTKIFYMLTPVPSGTRFFDAESKALAQGVTTFSPTNTTGFVDGESIGVAGVKDANGNVLTKVVGAPANATEYSISGTTYTVHSSLTAATGVTLYIAYGCDAGSGTAEFGHQDTIRRWMLSSDANFTYNGVDYAREGLLFGRPALRVIDMWPEIAQASNGANFYKAKHGTMDTLGVHPFPYAGVLAAPAFKARFDADYPAMPSMYLPATGNMCQVGSGTGATTIYGGALLPPSIRSAAGYRGNTNFRIFNSNFQALLINDGNGVFSLQMISGSFPAGTVDTDPAQTSIDGAGNWRIKTTANGTFTNSPIVRIIAEQNDTGIGRNLLLNPFFDTDATAHATAVGTFPATGGANPITGTPIPGWIFTVTSGLLTAIGNGTATLDIQPIAIGDGVNALQVTARGCVSTAWSISATSGISGSIPNASNMIPAGSRIRTHFERRLSAGPNGRCYGVLHFGSLSVSAGITTAGGAKFVSTGSTFTGNAAGTAQTGGSNATSNPTQMNASGGGGGPTYPWDDLTLAHAGGTHIEKVISPDFNMNPLVGGSLSISGSTLGTLAMLAGDANRPFSARSTLLLPAVRVGAV